MINLRRPTKRIAILQLSGSLDVFSVIFLLGAAQGIFLALLLSGPPRGSTANRLLALAMLAFSVDLVTAAYYNLGLQDRYPHFIGVDYLLPFLYGPLIYLYVRAMDSSSGRLRLRDWIHFAPIILIAVLFIPFYGQTGAEKLQLNLSPGNHPWMERLILINNIKFAYGLAYLIGAFVLLGRHRRRVRDTFSNVEHITLNWLRNLLVGGIVVWCISLGAYVVWMRSGTAAGTGPLEGYDDVVLIAVAVFVYAIGYLGLRQPEIFWPDIVKDKVIGDDEQAGPTRYARSGLNEETTIRIKEELTILMRNRAPYRNPELRLHDLAAALSVSTHNLSEVINSQHGQNFYDFVNAYRVAEVKERIDRGDTVHYTLLAIGMEAGFNSKSSFNAVFKKHAGMTPSDYRRRAGSV